MTNKIFIQLTNKKHGNQTMTIDLEDWHNLRHYKWYAAKRGNTFYATTYFTVNGISTSKNLHNFILNENPENKPMVHHVDGNGLNNSRSNLEYCDSRYNQSNQINRKNTKSSKYVGVRWHKKSKKWSAQIKYNGKAIHLGYYDDEIQAYDAYKNSLNNIKQK